MKVAGRVLESTRLPSRRDARVFSAWPAAAPAPATAISARECTRGDNVPLTIALLPLPLTPLLRARVRVQVELSLGSLIAHFQ